MRNMRKRRFGGVWRAGCWQHWRDFRAKRTIFSSIQRLLKDSRALFSPIQRLGEASTTLRNVSRGLQGRSATILEASQTCRNAHRITLRRLRDVAGATETFQWAPRAPIKLPRKGAQNCGAQRRANFFRNTARHLCKLL